MIAGSLGALVLWAQSELERSSSSARLDGEILLAHVLRVSRANLLCSFQDPVSRSSELQFRALIERRKQGEPIAYIIGVKEFWGREFEVSPAVLIPRPETELLVEEALKRCESFAGLARILDMGTGSGCIAISLAAELSARKREVRIDALDICEGALEVARRNAAKHGVSDDVNFFASDWFSAVNQDARYDLILSNPPYVDEAARNLPRELSFEPRQALFAAGGGLAEISSLIHNAPRFLAERGVILIEIGSDQRAALEAITNGKGRVVADLAGLARVLVVA